MDMNVFRQDAFSAIEMSMAVDRLAFVPSFLRSIPGLVAPAPVRTEEIWIEDREFAATIIPTSPRGAAPSQVGGDKRKARSFKTLRLAQGSRITPSELQNIRAFGTDELKSLQLELARRMMKIKQNFELTKEAWTLAMIQGKVIDADGTVLYDWSNEFSRAQPAEIAFGFSNTSPATDDGSIRKQSNLVNRTILRALRGLGGNQVSIYALCGDQFWDQLTTSKEVKQTYLNWSAAADLRGDLGKTFSAMRFGDINYFNYRGSDDNTAVAVATDKVKFFPVNAGIFQWALSPGEQFDFVNTLGQEEYAWMVIDPLRNMWADVEVATYPLPVCVAPDALMSGRAGA